MCFKVRNVTSILQERLFQIIILHDAVRLDLQFDTLDRDIRQEFLPAPLNHFQVPQMSVTIEKGSISFDL